MPKTTSTVGGLWICAATCRSCSAPNRKFGTMPLRRGRWTLSLSNAWKESPTGRKSTPAPRAQSSPRYTLKPPGIDHRPDRLVPDLHNRPRPRVAGLCEEEPEFDLLGNRAACRLVAEIRGAFPKRSDPSPTAVVAHVRGRCRAGTPGRIGACREAAPDPRFSDIALVGSTPRVASQAARSCRPVRMPAGSLTRLHRSLLRGRSQAPRQAGARSHPRRRSFLGHAVRPEHTKVCNRNEDEEPPAHRTHVLPTVNSCRTFSISRALHPHFALHSAETARADARDPEAARRGSLRSPSHPTPARGREPSAATRR